MIPSTSRRAARLPGALALLLCSLIIAGCRTQPLLYDVSVEPAAITPNQDGDADVARIAYSIGGPAELTVTFVAPDGMEYTFRDARPRSPGSYEAFFGGVVNGHMLPDGSYAVRLSAAPRADSGGAPLTETRPLEVHGGDTTPPELASFSVQPAHFSPNQDGLGDRVAISYRLDEQAEVRLWLEGADGRYWTDILEEEAYADYPGQPGPHVYDFDAGVDADAPPPPDGDYFIVGEARDTAGNVSRQELPLRIVDGGQPRVALLGDVDWSATVIPLGASLAFTVTVKNVGDTPVRTRGPEPGFVYDNDSSFNQTAPAEIILLARAGSHSVARHIPADRGDIADVRLDLASPAAPGAAAAADPGAAAAVEPGTAELGTSGEVTAATDADIDGTASPTITVCGTVRNGPAPAGGAEVIAFEVDGDNGVRISADSDGRFCLRDLALPPAHERTFARSPGAIRLGLEYDEIRTSQAYPYRWQLGPTAELSVCDADGRLYLCLPPDQTVTITGSVRFVDPPFRRTTTVYVALMHEDVRRMQGPFGQQQITVEY